MPLILESSPSSIFTIDRALASIWSNGSIAWPGGKIVSNKDEALASFLRRKLDQGQTLTAEQVGRLDVRVLFRIPPCCCLRSASLAYVGCHIFIHPRLGRCSLAGSFCLSSGLGASIAWRLPQYSPSKLCPRHQPCPRPNGERSHRSTAVLGGVSVNAVSTDCILTR